MSEEGKISLELINRDNKRKNLSFDLKKDDDINKLLECVVGGNDKSPMDLYVADLVIDNESKGAKNIEPIAKVFLYFSTLENGTEYIEKLRKNILDWENSTSYLPTHFSVKVNDKLKEILKQNGIDNDDLDIINNTPEEISKKLSRIAEKTQNLENKKPDLNKIKEFLLNGSFEKGFKEFKEGKNSTDAKLMRRYLEELEKNEDPKFSKEEIKIIENFNPVPIFGKGGFTDKYSDLLDEQAKKDLGPQEYGKVYSGKEKDKLVGDGYMQTLVSRTDSNQISYSEFVETEAYKNAISSIFDRAIKGDITLEESAEKVEEELKTENIKNKIIEAAVTLFKKEKNKTLNDEEKEYLNKRKEFLKKRNKKIKEYVKNYGLKGEEITEQKANSEEWRRINERFNSAITINQERIEYLEKILKNQRIKERKFKDRKSKLEKNSEHLQTARRMTIRGMLKMMWKKIKSTANKIFNLSNKILSEGEAIYKTLKRKTSKEEFSIASEKTDIEILNQNEIEEREKRDEFNDKRNTKSNVMKME